MCKDGWNWVAFYWKFPLLTCRSNLHSLFVNSSLDIWFQIAFFCEQLVCQYILVRRPSTMHQPCLITKCWHYVVTVPTFEFKFVSWQPNFASWGCRGNIGAHICQIPFCENRLREASRMYNFPTLEILAFLIAYLQLMRSNASPVDSKYMVMMITASTTSWWLEVKIRRYCSHLE